MPHSSAQLKGSLFTLSVLQLEDNDMEKLKQQLDNKLKQAPSFFFRAPLVVNIDQISDCDIDFVLLKKLIEAKDFVCVGICNGTTSQKQQARLAGLATLQQPKNTAVIKDAANSTSNVEKVVADGRSNIKHEDVQAAAESKVTSVKKNKIIRQNIRSGQQVYAKDSDLIIIGSVGNGAEVIADGNIHIYGKLRGRAIAGATGNKNSAIFCQSIEAELVSIAGTYWLSESIGDSHWQQSGFIKLEQEQLVVESLE